MPRVAMLSTCYPGYPVVADVECLQRPGPRPQPRHLRQLVVGEVEAAQAGQLHAGVLQQSGDNGEINTFFALLKKSFSA